MLLYYAFSYKKYKNLYIFAAGKWKGDCHVITKGQ